MKVRSLLVALALGGAAPAAAQVPGLDIDLRAGVNITDISDAPNGFVDKSSELGWFIGGDVKFPFAGLFYVEPGLYYQHQTVDLDDGANSDGLGIRSFMIPVQAGVNIDLKVVGAEVGIGPTLTFNTSVGGNDFDLEKDQLNNTRFGGMISGKVKVLFIGAWIGYQFDFTEAVKNGGGGKLNQWLFGLGINL